MTSPRAPASRTPPATRAVAVDRALRAARRRRRPRARPRLRARPPRALLRGRGHRVVAVDRDASALATLAGQARIETRAARSREPDPGRSPASASTRSSSTNYLHRPLFPHLLAALADDGVLLYETFARGNEAYGRPSNPDFLLRRDELLAARARAGLDGRRVRAGPRRVAGSPARRAAPRRRRAAAGRGRRRCPARADARTEPSTGRRGVRMG